MTRVVRDKELAVGTGETGGTGDVSVKLAPGGLSLLLPLIPTSSPHAPAPY